MRIIEKFRRETAIILAVTMALLSPMSSAAQVVSTDTGSSGIIGNLLPEKEILDGTFTATETEEKSVPEATESEQGFFACSDPVDGIIVTLTAAEGVLPEDAKLVVTKIEASSSDTEYIEAAVENTKLLDETEDEIGTPIENAETESSPTAGLTSDGTSPALTAGLTSDGTAPAPTAGHAANGMSAPVAVGSSDEAADGDADVSASASATRRSILDITLYDADGNEIQPDGDVEIKFTVADAAPDSAGIRVFHAKNDEETFEHIEEKIAKAEAEGKEVEFEFPDGELFDDVNQKVSKKEADAAVKEPDELFAEDAEEEIIELKETPYVAEELEVVDPVLVEAADSEAAVKTASESDDDSKTVSEGSAGSVVEFAVVADSLSPFVVDIYVAAAWGQTEAMIPGEWRDVERMLSNLFPNTGINYRVFQTDNGIEILSGTGIQKKLENGKWYISVDDSFGETGMVMAHCYDRSPDIRSNIKIQLTRMDYVASIVDSESKVWRFRTLQDAVNNVYHGPKVDLCADIELTPGEKVLIRQGGCTLDLNGHTVEGTYAASDSGLFTVDWGNLTIIDSSDNHSGKVINNSTDLTAFTVFMTSSNRLGEMLTFGDVEIKGANCVCLNGYKKTLIVQDGAEAKFTVSDAVERGKAISVENQESGIRIGSGEYHGSIYYSGTSWHGGRYITGGVYDDESVRDYVADGYIAIEKDGKYTVREGSFYRVTFDYNYQVDGREKIVVAEADRDGRVISPEVEPREGFVFTGWYKDQECTEENKYDFTVPVTTDCTLYAGWKKSAAKIGNTIYDSLQAAADVVKQGETIEVLADLELTDTVFFNKHFGSGESPVILDLNGHSITGSVSKGKLIRFSGMNITVADSSEKSKGSIENTSDTEGSYAISFEYGGSYWYKCAITGGTIKGYNAVYNDRCDLEIDTRDSGSSINMLAAGEGLEWGYAIRETVFQSNFHVNGDKIFIDGNLGFVQQNSYWNLGSGTYTRRPSLWMIQDSAKAAFEKTEDGKFIYIVDQKTKSTAANLIREVEYYTLQEAVDCAYDGATLTLRKVADFGTVSINKSISIDFNEKSVYGDINVTSGTLRLSGGLYDGHLSASGSSTNVILTGLRMPLWSVKASSGAKISITGGEYGKIELTEEGGEIEISGGSFKTDPTAYLAPGYVAVKSTDASGAELWTVISADQNEAVLTDTVHGVKYAGTLQDMMRKASDNDIVVLLKEIETFGTVTADNGKSFSLDLNDKILKKSLNLSNATTLHLMNGVLDEGAAVGENSKLLIDNQLRVHVTGNITADGTVEISNPETVFYGTFTAGKKGTVTLSAGKYRNKPDRSFIASECAVSDNPIDGYYVVASAGAKVTAPGETSYYYDLQSAFNEITESQLYDNAEVELLKDEEGQFVINNTSGSNVHYRLILGEHSLKGPASGPALKIINAHVVLKSGTIYKGSDGTAILISADNGSRLFVFENAAVKISGEIECANNANVSLMGGYYDMEPLQRFVSPGYTVFDDSTYRDFPYAVKSISDNAVARNTIKRNYYLSLKDAVDNANSGDKIELLKSVYNAHEKISVAKGITIDLAGYTYDVGSGDMFDITAGTTVIMSGKSGTDEEVGRLTAGNIIVENNAELILESGSYKEIYLKAADENSSIEIKGGYYQDVIPDVISKDRITLTAGYFDTASHNKFLQKLECETKFVLNPDTNTRSKYPWIIGEAEATVLHAGTVIGYASVVDAAGEMTTGDKLTLLKDITLADRQHLVFDKVGARGSITIDLNGKKLIGKYDNGGLLDFGAFNVTLFDSGNSGKVCNNSGEASSYAIWADVRGAHSWEDLIIRGGTYEGFNGIYTEYIDVFINNLTADTVINAESKAIYFTKHATEINIQNTGAYIPRIKGTVTCAADLSSLSNYWRIQGGLFAERPNDAFLNKKGGSNVCRAFINPDPLTEGTYPYAVALSSSAEAELLPGTLAADTVALAVNKAQAGETVRVLKNIESEDVLTVSRSVRFDTADNASFGGSLLASGAGSQIIIENGIYKNLNLAAENGGSISVTGGKFNSITAGSGASGFISGGLFKAVPKASCISAGNVVYGNTNESTKTDYPYEVRSGQAAAVTKDESGNTEYGFAFLSDAVKAPETENETVYLLKDIQEDTVTVNHPVTIVSDGENLFTVSSEDENAFEFISGTSALSRIKVDKNILVKNSGTVLNITDGKYDSVSAGEDAEISISGGHFKTAPESRYIAEGKALVKNSTDPDYTYSVVDRGDVDLEAMLTRGSVDLCYTRLSDAVKDAEDGTTVTLLKDGIVLTKATAFDHDITLDLNDHTLIAGNKAVRDTYGIKLNSSLTFKNGTIKSGAGSGYFGQSVFDLNESGITVVFEDIVMKECDTPVYWAKPNTTWLIRDGDKQKTDFDICRMTSGLKNDDMVCCIESGNFRMMDWRFGPDYPGNNFVTYEISGGSFNLSPNQGFISIPEGKGIIRNADSFPYGYSVGDISDCVAKGSGTPHPFYYRNIADAYMLPSQEDVLTLIADAVLQGNITVAKNQRIELDGHSLNTGSSQIGVNSGCTLTVTGGTLTGDTLKLSGDGKVVLSQIGSNDPSDLIKGISYGNNTVDIDGGKWALASDGISGSGKLTILSGKFANLLTNEEAYLQSGYRLIANWESDKAVYPYIVSDEEVAASLYHEAALKNRYTRIYDAVDAAADNDRVVLEKDIYSGDRIEIHNIDGRDHIDIDLGGHVMSRAGGGASDGPFVSVKGTATVSNGTLKGNVHLNGTSGLYISVEFNNANLSDSEVYLRNTYNPQSDNVITFNNGYFTNIGINDVSRGTLNIGPGYYSKFKIRDNADIDINFLTGEDGNKALFDDASKETLEKYFRAHFPDRVIGFKQSGDYTYKWELTTDVEAVTLDSQGSTVSYFDTVQSALYGVEDGQTVRLLKDVTLADETKLILTTPKKTVTLDLNGKTVTGNSASELLYTEYNVLTIEDSSKAKTGALVNESDASGSYVITCNNGSGTTLKITAGRYEGYNGIRGEHVEPDFSGMDIDAEQNAFYSENDHEPIQISSGKIKGRIVVSETYDSSYGRITGGIFTEKLDSRLFAGNGFKYRLTRSDDNVYRYTVDKESNIEAENNSDKNTEDNAEQVGLAYRSLGYAFADASSGNEINLIKSVSSDTPVEIPKTVYFDMNAGVSLNADLIAAGNGTVAYIRSGLYHTVFSDDGEGTFSIQGGKFSTAPNIKYIPEGCAIFANTDESTRAEYPYEVRAGETVAVVKNQSGEIESAYGSIACAVSDPGSEDKTVCLLNDVTEENTITVNHSVEIVSEGENLYKVSVPSEYENAFKFISGTSTLSRVEVDKNILVRNSGTVLNITDGKYAGTVTADGGSISITGGLYRVPVNPAYVAVGYIIEGTSDPEWPYAVVKNDGKYVASVQTGENVYYYQTLAEAIDSRELEDGSEIRLYKDSPISSNGNTRAFSKSVTLDLGGHTVTFGGQSDMDMNVAAGKHVTIQNGTVTGYLWGASLFTIDDYSDLTFREATVSQAPIIANLVGTGAKLIIESGYYSPDNYCITNTSGNKKLIINGGNLAAKERSRNDAYWNYHETEINGGNFSQSPDYNWMDHSGKSHYYTIGAGRGIVRNTDDSEYPWTVATLSELSCEARIPKERCQYQTEADAGIYYRTAAEAIADVNGTNRITLLKDATMSQSVMTGFTSAGTLAFDMNGHSFGMEDCSISENPDMGIAFVNSSDTEAKLNNLYMGTPEHPDGEVEFGSNFVFDGELELSNYYATISEGKWNITNIPDDQSGSKINPNLTMKGGKFNKIYEPYLPDEGEYHFFENKDADSDVYPYMIGIGHWVGFDLNGHGSPQPDSQLVVHGAAVSEPEAPSDKGYTFDGWWTQTEDGDWGSEWDFETDTVTKAMTLYAKWTVNDCLVEFNMNGHGVQVASQSVAYGGKVDKPEVSDPEYTLDGWYVRNGSYDSDWGRKWEFETDTVTEDMTLHAKWDINHYVVDFDMNGHGVQVASQSVAAGAAVSEPEAPYEDYYVFGGWFREKECRTPWNFAEDRITAPVTLHAKWDEAAAVVTSGSTRTYYADAEDAFRAAADGNTVTLLKPFDVAESVLIDKNIVLDLNGQTMSGRSAQYLVQVKDTDFTLKDSSPSQTGRIENLNQDRGTYAIVLMEDTEDEQQYTFTMTGGSVRGYNAIGAGPRYNGVIRIQGGTVTAAGYESDEYADAVAWMNACETINITGGYFSGVIDYAGAGSMEEAGHKVVGGYYNNNSVISYMKYGFGLLANEDEETRHEYPYMVAPAYRIDFVASTDGDYQYETPAQYIVPGGYVTKPYPDPTREGYTFRGWWTKVLPDEDEWENEWVFETATVSEDRTLWGRWEANRYKVEFNMNGHGTQVATMSDIAHGATIREPERPYAAGFEFDGWWTKNGADPEVADWGDRWNFEVAPVTEDMWLHAKWNEASAKLTGAGQSGTAKEVYFAELKDAVNAAEDGDTVTLLKDISTDETVVITQNITLDLAGKTLKGDLDDCIVKVDSVCATVSDSSGSASEPGTGKILNNSINSQSYAVSLVSTGKQDGGTLTFTLAGGELAGFNAVNGDWGYDVISMKNGSLYARGTTETAAGPGDAGAAISHWYYLAAIEIKAGKVFGEIRYSGAGGSDADGRLTGGIYSEKPKSNYLADKYGITPNTDKATKTVYPYEVVYNTEIVEYTVTFDPNGGTMDGDDKEQMVKYDMTATEPPIIPPVSAERIITLDGWYTEVQSGTHTDKCRKWDFDNDAVVQNVKLYAWWNETDPVASYQEEKEPAVIFATLSEAVQYANMRTGGTLKLLQDCVSEEAVSYVFRNDVTIDLNDKTLSVNNASGPVISAVGTDLTVEGGMNGTGSIINTADADAEVISMSDYTKELRIASGRFKGDIVYSNVPEGKKPNGNITGGEYTVDLSKREGYLNEAYKIVKGTAEYPYKVLLKTFAVNFVMNGHGTQIPSQTVIYNEKAEYATAYDAEYAFEGWWTKNGTQAGSDWGEEWDFDTPITDKLPVVDQQNCSITLYAKWSEAAVHVECNGVIWNFFSVYDAVKAINELVEAKNVEIRMQLMTDCTLNSTLEPVVDGSNYLTIDLNGKSLTGSINGGNLIENGGAGKVIITDFSTDGNGLVQNTGLSGTTIAAEKGTVSVENGKIKGSLSAGSAGNASVVLAGGLYDSAARGSVNDTAVRLEDGYVWLNRLDDNEYPYEVIPETELAATYTFNSKDITFGNLQTAKDYVNGHGGGTLRLENDYPLQGQTASKLAFTQNVTLDLNGKKITINAAEPAVTSTGIITVCDSSTAGDGAIINESGSALEVKYRSLSDMKCRDIIISGGHFKGAVRYYGLPTQVIKVYVAGDITGGSFSINPTDAAALYPGQSVDCSEMLREGYVVTEGSGEYPYSVSVARFDVTFVGNGGTFTETGSKADLIKEVTYGNPVGRPEIKYLDSSSKTDETKIFEGWFTDNGHPSPSTGEPMWGSKWNFADPVKSSFTLYAKWGHRVARIGETYYPSVQAAIDAAKSGDEVVVLENVTLYSPLNITAQNVTLNLNGRTLTANKASQLSNAVKVTSGEKNKVTVRNGSIINNAGTAISITSGTTALSGLTVQSSSAAVRISGGTTTLTNSSITGSTGITVNHTVNVNLNLTKSTVTGTAKDGINTWLKEGLSGKGKGASAKFNFQDSTIEGEDTALCCKGEQEVDCISDNSTCCSDGDYGIDLEDVESTNFDMKGGEIKGTLEAIRAGVKVAGVITDVVLTGKTISDILKAVAITGCAIVVVNVVKDFFDWLFNKRKNKKGRKDEDKFYLIEYDADGGAPTPGSYYVKEGNSIIVDKLPEKNGVRATTWKCSRGGTYNQGAKYWPSSNTTFTAQYSYKVSFKTADVKKRAQSDPATQTVKQGEKAKDPANDESLKKEFDSNKLDRQYKLEKWTPDGSSKFDFTRPIDRSYDLQAVWKDRAEVIVEKKDNGSGAGIGVIGIPGTSLAFDRKYKTLKEALDDANLEAYSSAGDYDITVKLLDDFDHSLALNTSPRYTHYEILNSMTLDLNGYKITEEPGDNGIFIIDHSRNEVVSLTVKDSSFAKSGAITSLNGNSVIYLSSGGAGKGGSVELRGGTIKAAGGDAVKLSDYGWVYITGSEVIAKNAIHISSGSGGRMMGEITDGRIDGLAAVGSNDVGYFEIKGGYFTDSAKESFNSNIGLPKGYYWKTPTGDMKYIWTVIHGRKVEFNPDGGKPEPQTPQFVKIGEKIPKPSDMTKKDYIFKGWWTKYSTGDWEKEWDFDHRLEESDPDPIRLYAKWEPVVARVDYRQSASGAVKQPAYYASVKEAFEEANTDTTAVKVTLLRDYTMTPELKAKIGRGRSYTFDIAGKTLSVSNQAVLDGFIYVDDGAALTITDSVGSGSITGAGDIFYNYKGHLILDSSLNITGSSAAALLKLNHMGDAAITEFNGGTYTNMKLEPYGGNVWLNNGKFKNVIYDTTNWGGKIECNPPVYHVMDGVYDDVTKFNIESKKAKSEYHVELNPEKPYWVSNTDSQTKTVYPWKLGKDIVARNNTRKKDYQSLQDALDDSLTGNDIELLKDTAENISSDNVTAAGIRLNLGNHAVTGTFANSFKVDMYNGSINDGGAQGEVLTASADVTLQTTPGVELISNVKAVNGAKISVTAEDTRIRGTLATVSDAGHQDVTSVIELKAGYYTQDVSAFCAEGYVCVERTAEEKQQKYGAYDYKVIFDNSVAIIEETQVKYDRLSLAIDESQTGQTIRLLANIDGQDAARGYELKGSTTLNLDGHDITTSTLIANGDGGAAQLMDTRESGLIKLGINDLKVYTNNEQLPVYDTANGGYRLFDYEFKALGVQSAKPTEGKTKHFYKLVFPNSEGYKVLSQGNHGLQFVTEAEYQKDGVTKTIKIEFVTDVIDEIRDYGGDSIPIANQALVVTYYTNELPHDAYIISMGLFTSKAGVQLTTRRMKSYFYTQN